MISIQSVQGNVFLIDPQGRRIPVQAGTQIPDDAVLVAADDAVVEWTSTTGQAGTLSLSDNQPITMAQVVAQAEADDTNPANGAPDGTGAIKADDGVGKPSPASDKDTDAAETSPAEDATDAPPLERGYHHSIGETVERTDLHVEVGSNFTLSPLVWNREDLTVQSFESTSKPPAPDAAKFEGGKETTSHVGTGPVGSGDLHLAGGSGTLVPATHEGQFGTFHVNTDGTWTYTPHPGNTALGNLGGGQTGTDTFQVFAKGPDGNLVGHSVVVDVTGTNEAPTISGVFTGPPVTEAQTAVAGQLTATDPDAGDKLTWNTGSIDGQYGTFHLGPDGQWAYQLDPSRPATQGLTEGQQVTETFPVAVTDQAGASGTANITVQVTGSNALPVISGSQSGEVTEGAPTDSTQGTLVATDPDTGDQVTWAVTSANGTYGNLSIDPNTGEWTYQLDNTRPATTGLAAGTQATETFTVTATDSSGQPVAQQVAVTIHGTNNQPVIAGTASGQVVENAAQATVSGTLSATDADSGDQLSWSLVNGQGAYGSLHIDPQTGRWEYTLDNQNPQTDALTAGQQVSESFVVHATDASGNPVSQTVTIGVTGSNDLPSIHGATTGAVVENASTDTTSGQLGVTDPDTGDSLSWSVVDGQGQFGSLQIDPNTGRWSYQLDNNNPATDALAAGDHQTESFVIQATDSSGQPVSQTITVGVSGSNDGPVIAQNSVADGSVNVSGATAAVMGHLDATDVDQGAQLAWSLDHTDGVFGQIALDPSTGRWSYQLDPSAAATRALAEGEKATEKFTATVTDEHGATSTHQIVVTLTGSNDVPTIGAIAARSTDEDQRIEGQITTSDVDAGDHLTLSIPAPVDGLTLTPDGHYTFDAGAPAYQHLQAGQQLDLHVPILATDAQGVSTCSYLNLTVTGTNDSPVVGGLDHALGSTQGTAGGPVTIDGALTILDVDQGEAHFAPQILHGNYGFLNIDPSGQWHYSADSSQGALTGLLPTQSAQETFTVRTADGTTHEIHLEIHGGNTPAIFGGVSNGLVIEDKAGQISHQLVIHDLNVGESSIVAQDRDTAHGHFTIGTDGKWTFTLDQTNPAVQALAATESLTERILVGSADGTPHMITVNIAGTNDLLVIAGVASGAATEGVTTETTGKLTVTDVDATDQTTISMPAGAGQYGTFTIDPDGTWHYQLDSNHPAVDSLNAGDPLTDSVVVTVADNHGGLTQQTITVNITGTNDAPVIGSSSTHLGITDADGGSGNIDGQLVATDVDQGATLSWSLDHADGSAGRLTLDPQTGQWHYQLDSASTAARELPVGQSLTETFTATVTDEHGATATQEIKVVVTGTNDTPVLGAVTAQAVDEGSAIRGQITATDVDSGDTIRIHTVAPIPGLTLHEDGSYTFDATDPAYNHLADGQTKTLTIPVFATDQHGASDCQNLQITITGTNDKPVVGGIDHAIGAVSQAGPSGNLSVTGSLSVLDIDDGESHFQAQLLKGSYGVLSIDRDGQWSYTADASQPDLVRLKGSDERMERFLVQTADGTTHEIDLVLRGQDTPAVIQGTTMGMVTEDKDLAIVHKLSIMDPDAGQDIFRPEDRDTAHGHFSLQPDGTWTFLLNPTDPAVQALALNETLTEKIIVGSADGTPCVITVNIFGSNDTPVIGGVFSGLATEGSATEATGQMVVSDLDATDTHTFTLPTQAGQYGQFSVDPDGTWHYHLDSNNPDVDALGVGAPLTDRMMVTVSDGSGGLVQQELVVHITGTNDAPQVSSAVTLAAGTEDTAYTLHASDLLAHATDVDTGETAQLSVHNLAAVKPDGTSAGTITDNADGTFTFTPEANYNGAVTFNYAVQDPQGASVSTSASLTLAAVNDAAVIAGQDTASLDEFGSHGSAYSDITDRSPDYHHSGSSNLFNQILSVSGDLTITDPDRNEAEFLSPAHQIRGQYGLLSISEQGHWVYQVSAGTSAAGRAIDKLGAGEELTDTITIHSKDGTPHDIVITIHGDNDRPYCSSEVILNAGTEDTRQTLTTAQLLANTVDVDKNDAGLLTIENLHADHGSILNNADGTFTFTPEKDYNGDVHFTYDVKDAHGGVTHTGASTNLSAVSDAAVITGVDTGSITEDHNVTHDSAHGIQVMGSLSVTDPDAGQDHFIKTDPFVRTEHAISDPFNGELHITSSGNWDYRLSNDNPQVQALAAGETKDVIYEVHSADGTAHRITITVTGTNDTPKVSSAVTLAQGTEDTDLIIHATDLLAHASDIDHGDTLSVQNLVANHGAITDNHDGTYTFHPDKDYNGQVHFTYDVKDAHGGVTHTGATTSLSAVGDAATITGQSTGVVTEDVRAHTAVEGANFAYKLETSGTLSVQDPDSGEAGFDFRTLATAAMHPEWAPYTSVHGGFLGITPQGEWTYYIDTRKPEIQALGDGKSLIDTVEIHSKDGTTHTITITIEGTNDGPIVSGATTLTAGTEDTAVTLHAADLLAHASDVDTGETAQLSVHGLAAVKPDGSSAGTITDNGDGTFTFTPEANYNGAVTFNYAVQDPQGASVSTSASLTLAAVNDAAVITGTGGHLLEEDNRYYGYTIKTSGQFHVVDPDGPSQSQFPDGLHHHTGSLGGTLQLYGNGNYFYHIENSAVNHLPDGQEARETFTIHSVDGTAHQVEFVIEGTNDAPFVRGGATLSPGAEDTAVTLHASDLLAQAGDYDDGETAQLTVHNLAAVKPDGTSAGTIADNHDGTFTFTPEANYNGAVSFNYEVQDPHGASAATTASMNLAAVRDAATFTGDETGAVKEDTGTSRAGSTDQLVASGTLSIHDPDGPSEESFDFKRLGERAISDPFGGNLHISQSGMWSYVVDNNNPALQALKEGETRDVVYQVVTRGYSTHEITITVTGTNDAPVVSGTTTLATGTEDTAVTLHASDLLAHASDVDTGETAQLSVHNLAAVKPDGSSAGTITDNGDGTFTFTPEANYNGAVTFNYDVQDPHGAGAATTASLSLAATSDVATISGDDQTAVSEDHTSGNNWISSNQNTLSVTDPDAGESLFRITGNPTGGTGVDEKGNWVNGDSGLGQFILHANGEWFYRVDNSQVQHLGDQEKLTETLTVYSADGTAQVLTATVTGTNDAPTVTATAASPVDLGTTDEDTTKTFTEAELLHLVGAADVDSNDTLHVTAISSPHGTFAKDAGSGDWTFTPAADFHGDNVALSLTVNDGHTDVTAHGTIDVAPVTDAATVGLTMSAEQEILSTGSSGRIMCTNLGASQPLTEMTMEFTVIGQAAGSGTGSTGPVILNMGASGSNNLLSLWNPANMKIGGAGDVATGINLTDGSSHRITLSWTSASGQLKVFDNGQLVTTVDNYHQGGSLPADAYMVLGQKWNNPGDTANPGWSSVEHYEGQIFNAAISSKALSEAQVGQAPLASLLDHSSGLLIDVRSVGSQMVDNTGTHTLAPEGMSHSTAQVDTSLTPPPPGSLLHLNVNVTTPADRTDTVTQTTLLGVPAGVTLSDGTHTVATTGSPVDLNGWHLDQLTAQLPADKTNFRISVEVETTGPDGTTAIARGETAVVMDPTHPVPDATIAGDSDGTTTDDDTAVAGQLTISDPDASQAHFQAGDQDGQYGKLTLQADGHWTYTPDDRADALTPGHNGHESFVVTSADGTTHQVQVTITGSVDSPTITGTSQSGVTEDQLVSGKWLSTNANQLTVSDPDPDQSSFQVTGHATSGTGVDEKGSWVDGDKGIGQFILHANGEWFYRVDNDQVQHLGASETLTETLTVHTADGSPQVLTATITGTNDAPTLTSSADGTTHEVAITVTGSDEAPAADEPDAAADDDAFVQLGLAPETSADISLDQLHDLGDQLDQFGGVGEALAASAPDILASLQDDSQDVGEALNDALEKHYAENPDDAQYRDQVSELLAQQRAAQPDSDDGAAADSTTYTGSSSDLDALLPENNDPDKQPPA